MSLKEKLQITSKGYPENGEEWASFESARDTHGVEKEHGLGEKYNLTPPGMDIDHTCRPEPSSFQSGFGGDTDVTGDIEPNSLIQGYRKRVMQATDDQYDGEHVDLFYGDAGGFCERNNYMDRN